MLIFNRFGIAVFWYQSAGYPWFEVHQWHDLGHKLGWRHGTAYLRWLKVCW